MIEIRNLTKDDAVQISKAFVEQGWNKPIEQYINYYEEQELGKRYILVAEYNNEFAGYITIVWNSDYIVFKKRNLPELMDFNVLEKFQRKGIGRKLLLIAEEVVKKKSKEVGIRVGVLKGYGQAQRLYVKLGYIPDGEGISKDNHFYKYFEKTEIDDDLAIGFTKVL
ncbi:GNAT family N-acetyltransferase [Vallitalea okinawensis]|uniref:GNAT family N-acetyltransferase n=1 Tax=Vallitalea okinawensis TaxID=2078660 RepID=UPI001A9A3322|nr:GNAT family N-acetyltransferase [Vallitalea okinawensis]